MRYELVSGEPLNIGILLLCDQDLYCWMIEEYQTCRSLKEFTDSTEQKILDRVQYANHHHYRHHPLYKVQKDLAQRLSVKEHQSKIQAIESLMDPEDAPGYLCDQE